MGNTIPSYSEWCDNLSDNNLEELELTKSDLEVAYTYFVSMLQDNAYDQHKDDSLLDS